MKIYTYSKCSTCRNATKWLKAKGIAFEEIPIRDTPPSKKELKAMLEIYDGDVKRLFNTSGMDYRSMDMKTKLPTLSEAEALSLLTENGNLVKRPFLLEGDSKGIVGFKEADWEELLV